MLPVSRCGCPHSPRSLSVPLGPCVSALPEPAPTPSPVSAAPAPLYAPRPLHSHLHPPLGFPATAVVLPFHSTTAPPLVGSAASAELLEAAASQSAGLHSSRRVGWDFSHPQSRVPVSALRLAADGEEEGPGDARASSLVATKLLENFTSSVAQRGGVESLRAAMRYADSNGDGAASAASARASVYMCRSVPVDVFLCV
jgi:hypothetical protein